MNQDSKSSTTLWPTTGRVRVGHALALALAACAGLGACADGVAQEDEVAGNAGPLAPAKLDELRREEPPSEQPPEFTAGLQASGARAQRYLDDKIVPRIDDALREFVGRGYAELQAEVAEISTRKDPEEIKAGLEEFYGRNGEAIEKALDAVGTSTAELAEELRREAFGDAPPPEPKLMAAGPQPRAGCSTGFEFEPFPPYFQTGNWWWGVNSAYLPTTNVDGTIRSESVVIVGPASGVGGWVRADNLPPRGAGTTTVSTLVTFPVNAAELFLWFPSYVGSGVGLTIDIFDGGPGGRRIASCRRPLIDRSLPLGYLFDNRPTEVSHSCTVHHPSSSFLTTKVHIDTYGTNFTAFGGFARAVGDARVRTIRYLTCLD